MILVFLLLAVLVPRLPVDSTLGFPVAVLLWLGLYLGVWHRLRTREKRIAARRQAIALEEFPALQELHDQRERTRAQHLGEREYLESLPPREFEYAVAEVLHRAGYEGAKVGPGVADYGVDVTVQRGQVTYVVQVKQWAQPVHRQEIQKLQGAMIHFKAGGGIFVTLGRFSKTALEYAAIHGITTIDGDELVALARKGMA
jgi:restriction endonuclease Mrr